MLKRKLYKLSQFLNTLASEPQIAPWSGSASRIYQYTTSFSAERYCRCPRIGVLSLVWLTVNLIGGFTDY